MCFAQTSSWQIKWIGSHSPGGQRIGSNISNRLNLCNLCSNSQSQARSSPSCSKLHHPLEHQPMEPVEMSSVYFLWAGFRWAEQGWLVDDFSNFAQSRVTWWELLTNPLTVATWGTHNKLFSETVWKVKDQLIIETSLLLGSGECCHLVLNTNTFLCTFHKI